MPARPVIMLSSVIGNQGNQSIGNHTCNEAKTSDQKLLGPTESFKPFGESETVMVVSQMCLSRLPPPRFVGAVSCPSSQIITPANFRRLAKRTFLAKVLALLK